MTFNWKMKVTITGSQIHLPVGKWQNTDKCNFVNEKSSVLMLFTLKSVPWDVIDGESSLVKLVAKYQTGNKPLS